MNKTAAKLLFIFLISVCVAARLNAQGYTVSGRVIDSLTSLPVMGVYVTTDNNRGSQTDRNGEFVIKDISPGEHTIRTMYFSDYTRTGQKIAVDSDISGLTLKIRQQDRRISQVVVTGTRTERRLADSPILTTVISERDIEKAGSTSLVETLQDNIPGIVFEENEMGNNMKIRGLTSRYVLFLVDGERLVSEGAGGNINFDQIDIGNIARIEIINGAASAVYGSNAVGGVINIITKDPAHTVEAGANAAYESNNTWKTRIDAGTVMNRFSVRAGGFRNSSDGFDKGGAVYAARYEDWGGDIKFGYKPSDRIDLNVTGRYFSHETFNPDNSMNATHPLTYNMNLGFNGGMRSADGSNNLRGSVNYGKYFAYEVPEHGGGGKQKENTVSHLSARLADAHKINERWEVSAGMEYNYEEVYAKTTLGPEPVSKDINDINGFGQAQYTPIEAFDILVGARFTHNSQFGNNFSPKLSLMYELADLKFRGDIGRAFRAPSIKEMYYNFDHGGMFWIYGNPDLKAEKGIHTTLSAEYDNGTLNASGSAYHNKINDKINQYEILSATQNERHYTNVSSATLKGFDVNVAYTLMRQFVLRGSYVFCDARDNSTGLQLPSNTKHSVTTSATWNGRIARSPFSLQFAGRVHSPKLYQTVTIDESDNEIVTKNKSKSYSIWKVTLVKPVRLKKHTFELTLKADNIFGFKDDSFVNPGRRYMAGLRYKFKQTSPLK